MLIGIALSLMFATIDLTSWTTFLMMYIVAPLLIFETTVLMMFWAAFLLIFWIALFAKVRNVAIAFDTVFLLNFRGCNQEFNYDMLGSILHDV